MSETDRDELKIKLDDLSRRLETRIREFAEHGELLDQQHQSWMTEIQRRRARIQTKLDSVDAHGAAWDVIKTEIESELSSLSDKLALFNERLDADEMKQRAKCRQPLVP
jgi:hypothetical protein